jgi:hypothetical protein
MSWKLLIPMIEAALNDVLQKKLTKIKANLLKRGWDVTVILKAHPGTNALSFFKDVVGAITDAF